MLGMSNLSGMGGLFNLAPKATKAVASQVSPLEQYEGAVRFNTATGQSEIYTNGQWAPVGGAPDPATQLNGAPTPGNVLGTSAQAAAAPAAAAPAKVLDAAQLNSLDSLIASIGTIRDQAKAKAAIKRDTSQKEKQDEKMQEETKYNGKKLSTLQEFSGAKTDTDLNTRNTLENLMSSLSTLGLGGARALTRQILDAANMSNRKANSTQATNNQGLDTAWNEYVAGNENDMKKIQDQFGYDSGEAERKYLQDKQTALYKKADVYNAADRTAERERAMSEGNSLNSLIAGAAFMNPSYTGETKAVKTPDLASYAQDIAKYDTTSIGANTLTPVKIGAPGTPGNLAIRAMAVNDKDLGIKKKAESDLGYGV